MTNANKAKGTRFETDVVKYLRSRGLPAVKPRQEGHEDVGDIHSCLFTIQCKDWRDVSAAMREAVDGAARQAGVRAKRSDWPWMTFHPVGVVKRSRKGTQEAYVIVTLETFATMAQELLKP